VHDCVEAVTSTGWSTGSARESDSRYSSVKEEKRDVIETTLQCQRNWKISNKTKPLRGRERT